MRQPGDSTPPSTGPATEATSNTEANSLLKLGNIYSGEVVSYESNDRYTVRLTNPKTTLHGVALALPFFGGLMGYRMRTRLPEKAQVRLVYGRQSFIFTAAPEDLYNDSAAGPRLAVHGEPTDLDAKDSTNFPDDMLEGEIEIGNDWGMALRFLTTMMQVSAGDRATIEAHAINHMVRIICEQYHAVTGIGDETIFDYGRPTLERSWSSWRHEVFGALKEGEDLFARNGDGSDRETLTAERVTKEGRHRLLEFIGFAGDFMHSFIADPPKVLVDLATEGSGRRGGKSWIHRNSDGSLVIQSVADIMIERVTRIPVPYRKKHHADPALENARKYRDLSQDALKLWKWGSQENQDAYRTAYQLRSYSRWLSRFHAFARMIQLGEEYDLAAENDAAYTPEWTNGEPDKEKAAEDEYFETYSCINIMRDGSIVLHDGYGSSVVMSNGNVQVSAARNLDLEAAGDIRMVAGNSIFMKAQRNIEVSAVTGKFISYAYAGWKALCEAGILWLRSDAGGSAKSAKNGGPDPEFAATSIYLEAPGGEAMIRTGSRQSFVIEDGKDDLEDLADTQGDFIFKGSGHFRSNIRGSVLFSALRNVVFSGARDVVLRGRNMLTKFAKIQLAKGAIIQPSRAFFDQVVAEYQTVNSFIRAPRIGLRPDSDRIAVPPHSNHIGLLEPEDKITWDREIDDADLTAVVDFSANDIRNVDPPYATKNEGPLWQFFEPEVYAGDPLDGNHTQTITQRFLEVDGEAGNYSTWTWSGDRAGITTRTGTNLGMFGAQIEHGVATGGQSLHVPSPTAPSAYTLDQGWTTKAVVFRFTNRS